MQIKPVDNLKLINKVKNFKGNSETPASQAPSQEVQPAPLEASKAYASPQITEGYREISTFKVPYVGQGKLYELSNGHKVVLVSKASKTYISTRVGVGFNDEPADRKDMAHLTEHLLANYWHNADSTSNITKTLSEAGAYSNAITYPFSTIYHMSAEVQDNNDLNNLLKIQLNTLTNNHFNENAIEKEKNTIIEEAKENNYYIDGGRIARKQTLKNLFDLNESNGMVGRETFSKVKDITKTDLDKFYNNFYRPDNMTTIIIGNVDDNSIKVVSKYLNKMQNPKNKLERNNTSGINQNKYIKQFKKTDIESPDKSNKDGFYTEFSFIGPKVDNQEDTERLCLLYKILENRLKQKNILIFADTPTVSDDKNVPQAIRIGHYSFSDDDTTDANNTIYLSIFDLAKSPVSKEELNRAKANVFTDLANQLEKNEILQSLLFDLLMFNQQMNLKSSFMHYKNISPADIQNVAKKYLDLDKASMVIVHPNKEAVQKSKEVSFKGLAELSDEKDIKEYNLPNNLHVIIDSRPGTVKAAVSCLFLYENDQKYNHGMIKALDSALINSKDNESPEGNIINDESIILRKYGFSENIEKMVTQIKEDAINPEFNNYQLEESKSRQRKNQIDDRNYKFYEKREDITKYINRSKSANDICDMNTTKNDFKNYYNYLLNNSQGTVIITIPKEKLEKTETEILKTLSEIPKVRPRDLSKISRLEEPESFDKNEVWLFKKDDSNKVEIKKDFKIIYNGDIKEEAEIMLLNRILRYKLGKHLREELGLTYSASSIIEKKNAKEADLKITTEIAKSPLASSTKTAIAGIDSIINELINTKVDNEVLNNSKKQVKSNLLIPSETTVDRNLEMEYLNKTTYDVNHNRKLAETIDNITPDDVQNIAKKYLTQNYNIDLVGSKKAIEANEEYIKTLGKVVDFDKL